MSEESGQTSSSPSLFIFCIGATFFLMNAWSFRGAYVLKHEGTPIQGTVARTYIVKHRGSVSYKADYTINISGTPYEGSADITRGTFLAAHPGGPIALRYSPSNPSISESAELSHSATTLFLTEFLGFPVSLFILFLAFRKQPRTDEEQMEAASEQNIDLPNTVKGVAFTMYPVTDMKRARKFYEEDLGLKPEHDVGGKWIEYHLWDSCFAITTMAGDAVKPSAEAGGSIAFEVQNVDEFVDQLRKKGIRVKEEPFSTRVCRMAVVVDPEGNALTLHAKNSK
jgi:predicted enzyme related to lactoylglutathione lyase